MKCQDCIEWIALKLDGTLPYGDLEKLDAHIKGCDLCRMELKLQTEIQESLKREMPSGLSSDFTRRVSREALALAGKEKKRWQLPDLVPVFSLAAASILLFVFRSEVAQFLSPATQALGSALAAGGAAAGDAVQESATGLLAESTYLENLFTPTATMMTAGVIAVGTVFWSLSQVRSYLRG